MDFITLEYEIMRINECYNRLGCVDIPPQLIRGFPELFFDRFGDDNQCGIISTNYYSL